MSASANNLQITINADTAEAVSRIEQFFHAFADNAQRLSGMSSFLGEFGQKLFAAFAVGSIVEFAKHAIEIESALDRMSQKSGISIGMLEGLRDEAAKNGIAFEELDAGLVMFAERIFQAVRHGGQLAEVFRGMKIPLVEANGQLRPIDDILLEVAKKFQTMAAGPEKAALAMELFGRSGRQFIQMLSLSTTELIAKMKEHGAEQTRNAAQAEEFHRSIADLSLAFEKMWMDLSSSLLPTLQKFAESMKDGVQWVAIAIKDGGTLNQVLKQTALLLTAVAAARLGASFAGLFGGIGSASELVTALGLVLSRLKAIAFAGETSFLTSPVVAYTAVIAALSEEIRTGVEMWRQWKAAKEEALSGERVKEQDTQLEVALNRAIDAQEKAHTISTKVAEIYRNAVSDAFKTSPDAIALHDRLTNLMRSLHTHAEGEQQQKQAAQPTIGPSDREIKMAEARIQAWLQSEAGAIAISDAQNEALYKKRTISVETYFAVKKRLLEKSTQDELTALQKELVSVNQQRRDPQNAANKEKQDDLALKHEGLLNKLIEVRQKLRAALAQLSGEKWVEEQNNAKKMEEIEQGRSELRLSHIKSEQSLIQSDPNLSELEKAQQLIPWLKKENDEIQAQIDLELKRQKTANLKPDAKLESQKKVEALRQEMAELNRRKQDGEGKTSFGSQFISAFADLRTQWGTWATQMAASFKNVFNGAISSISNGITGLIMQTKTWKQALTEIGTSIVTNIVQAIVEMGVRWTATQLMTFMFGQSLQAANVAAASGYAALYSAAWATPAALATIASYGAAAAQAPGLIAIAEGATMAESIAPRAMGGSVFSGTPYLVGERGPEIFMPRDSGTITSNSQSKGFGGGGDIHIALVASELHANKYLDSVQGEKHVMNILRKNNVWRGQH